MAQNNNTQVSDEKASKLLALKLTMDKIDKTYGKGTIMKMSDQHIDKIPVISSGSLGLDIALGVGGYPRGRIIEIYGPESSGKTTLAIHAIAEAQKTGGTAAFIDAEHAFDRFYAEKLGVNMNELLISQPDILHLGLNFIKTEPVGEGNEDEHRFGKDLVPLVLRHEFDGPAVVEPVGQFYEDDTHIIVESEEDTLEILGLEALGVECIVLVLVFIVENGLDLGKSVHQGCYLVSEKVPDVFGRVIRIFDDIMEECCGNGFVSEADFIHNYPCDSDRVYDIWFTGTSPDVLMSFIREIESLLDYCKFLFVGTALGGNFLETGIILGDPVKILFCKLRKTHLNLLFLLRPSVLL